MPNYELKSMKHLISWVYRNCKFATNQTSSPEFLNWFGNSKVVDNTGKPLVVYKGMYPYDYTKEEGVRGFSRPEDRKIPSKDLIIDRIQRPGKFPSFHKDKDGNEEEGIDLAGFFGGKETANIFSSVIRGGATYPAYLSLQNPYIVDAAGQPAGKFQFGESGIPFREAMRSGQYDGAIIKNTKDEGTIYVAKHPDQIKSAITNEFLPKPSKAPIPDSQPAPKMLDEVTAATRKEFHCKIYRGIEIKAEGRWFDASQNAAESKFMFKHTGSALKRHILQNAGWICECKEIQPVPIKEAPAKQQQRLLFDNSEQPFQR